MSSDVSNDPFDAVLGEQFAALQSWLAELRGRLAAEHRRQVEHLDLCQVLIHRDSARDTTDSDVEAALAPPPSTSRPPAIAASPCSVEAPAAVATVKRRSIRARTEGAGRAFLTTGSECDAPCNVLSLNNTPTSSWQLEDAEPHDVVQGSSPPLGEGGGNKLLQEMASLSSSDSELDVEDMVNASTMRPSCNLDVPRNQSVTSVQRILLSVPNWESKNRDRESYRRSRRRSQTTPSIGDADLMSRTERFSARTSVCTPNPPSPSSSFRRPSHSRMLKEELAGALAVGRRSTVNEGNHSQRPSQVSFADQVGDGQSDPSLVGCASCSSMLCSSDSSHSIHSGNSGLQQCYEVLSVWYMMRTTTRRSEKSQKRRNPGASFSGWEDDPHSEEDESTKRCRKFMVAPGTGKHISWDFIGLAFIGWDCMMIPLMFFDLEETVFTLVMAWVCRVFWTLNIATSFLIGYIDAQGSVEMDGVKVAKRYLVTWFPLDIFIVATDWLEVDWKTGGSMSSLKIGNTLRTLRMLRTVRLLRMIKAPLKWKYFTEQIRSEELILVAHIGKVMIVMLVWAHFIACGWYGIGDENFDRDGWIQNDYPGLQGQELPTRYFLCFHWSLSIFTGDTLIEASNLPERGFTVFSLFFALIFSAFVISSMTTAMTRLQIISSHTSSQLCQLRRYLVDRGISRKLAIRVQRNAQHVMMEQKRNMPESNVELLNLISGPLLVELHFEVHSPVLMEHPFFCCFNDINPAGIRRVCHTAISLLSLSSGDVLFSDSELPAVPRMFFVTSGVLMYKQEGSGVQDTMTVDHGHWLSEGCLWTSWAHCGTLRATTESRLVVTNAKTFQDMCVAFPMIQMMQYAEAFVEVLNTTEKPQLTDIGVFDADMEDIIAFAFPELVYHADEPWMADDQSSADGEHAKEEKTFSSKRHSNGVGSHAMPEEVGSPNFVDKRKSNNSNRGSRLSWTSHTNSVPTHSLVCRSRRSSIEKLVCKERSNAGSTRRSTMLPVLRKKKRNLSGSGNTPRARTSHNLAKTLMRQQTKPFSVCHIREVLHRLPDQARQAPRHLRAIPSGVATWLAGVGSWLRERLPRKTQGSGGHMATSVLPIGKRGSM